METKPTCVLSKDYEDLYERVTSNQNVLAFVDYEWPDNTVDRDPVSVHISGGSVRINSRGVEYGRWAKPHEKQMFIEDCQRLNLQYVALSSGERPVTWHKPREFPPDPIPEGHVLIGYSNRKRKDEDYSLRQLACYAPQGPWTDWYGHIPNPDRWAIIPIPEKANARWHMPKRVEGEELVRAGNAMRKELGRICEMQLADGMVNSALKSGSACDAWDAALPKDTGGTTLQR